MKSRRHGLPVPLLLVLLLVLTIGGWGIYLIRNPDGVPGWLRSLAGNGTPDSSRGSSDSGSEGASAQNPGQSPGDPATADGPADSNRSGGLDPRALPVGLTTIDGEAGTGIDRAVKKNGVWFPVYSPGPHPGSGTPPLTVIPLSIASGNPPPGRVNELLQYAAEAIGGAPPYQWSAAITPAAEASAFTLAADTGLLTGLSATPLSLRVSLTVTDAAGVTDSAALALTIRPEQDLTITSTTLPPFPPGLPPDLALTATGGVPPYHWSTAGSLPEGLTLEASTGLLSGSTGQTGAWPLRVTVTDAQQTAEEADLMLTCQDSLTITTPETLPPALPGDRYSGAFEAEGGTPPYLWELTSGSLPDSSWQLSPEGFLTGGGGAGSGLAEFTLTVSDAEGVTFEKTFRIAVSDLLTAIPSREKAGLAWQPAAVAALLSGSGVQPAAFRVLRDGTPVYEGSRSNFVDRNLPNGSTPRYTLVVLTTDGDVRPVAEKQIAILPPTLSRAAPGSTCDPYADRVLSFQPLTAGGYGSAFLPDNVTGPPDGRSVWSPVYRPGEVLSLHARTGAGGSVELEFTDNIVELAPGEDLTIFENVLFIGGSANQRFMEPATVSVALFPGDWHALPCDAVPPADGQPLDLRDPFYYARGFAGRNGTTGEDPTNPARSGGDSLDLDEAAARAGLTWIRYLRITSTGDQSRYDNYGGDLIRHPDDPAFQPLSGTGSSGFDLDAVSAVHW